MSIVRWDVPLFVTLDLRTRRLLNKRLGKRGPISKADFADAVGELVGDWIVEAIAEADAGRPT